MALKQMFMVGGDWLDGFMVGRQAAIAEWAMRKRIDDPEFKRLVWRLRANKYWAEKTPEQKAKVRAQRDKWQAENAERYRDKLNETRRRGRKRGAVWNENEKLRKRKKHAEKMRSRRQEVHTCEECGAQWCIALGRLPTGNPPSFCSIRCKSRNYRRSVTSAR